FIMRDRVVGHALLQDGVLYVGQHGLFRVQPGIEAGTRESAPYYEPKPRALPGQPPFLPDGYQAVAAPDAASRSVRIAWRARTEDEKIRFDGGAFYFVFYRLLFAFDADEDRVRWVHVHPADIVGIEVTPEGPFLVDKQGVMLVLDARDG